MTGRLSRRDFLRQTSVPILLSTGVWGGLAVAKARAQGRRWPYLRYQAPDDYETYWVDGGDPGPIQGFMYSVPSGSDGWSDWSTAMWRRVDRNYNPNPTPGFVPDEDGRLGHQFYLDQYSWPDWDPDGTPRIEFVTAVHDVQWAATPDGLDWDQDGIIVPGTEYFYKWSMYLDSSLFSTAQQWANLIQFKPSSGNYDYVNGWPDTNYWPTLEVNGNRIKFSANGFPPDNPLWNDSLDNYLDKWTNFALYANWSTGSDGRLIFFVDRHPVADHSGNNFYQSTNGDVFYCIRQGYYRAKSITTQDIVYQSPLLVSTRLP